MPGTPATAATLPPDGAEQPPTAARRDAFANRLHDLATQIMAPEPDRLEHYRLARGGHRMP